MKVLFLIATGTAFGLVLMVPTVDLSNPPVAAFAIDTGAGTEVTIVFSDEDHPNPVVDLIYDVYRFFKWGRIADVETFYVREDQVYFPDDFASVVSFFQTEGLHTEMVLPISDFEVEDGEIVIYVNTWNHMFSNVPLPGMVYVPVKLEFREGSRVDVERIYSVYK